MLRLFWSSGLPWSSHDGYPRDRDTSGKYLKGDRFRADGVTLATSTLALGWWFGRSDAYLRRAVLLLRTFFLDEATSMNPNMNFAQGVPGRVPGEPGGTVDFGRIYVLPLGSRIRGQNRFPPPEHNTLVLEMGCSSSSTVCRHRTFPTRIKHPVLTRPISYLEPPFLPPIFVGPRCS